jgi:ABC-type nickel/cobalt efflux system permease component RcnA
VLTWTLIFTVTEVLWILGIGTVVVLQRRSAAATLAWLMVLGFLPLIGFVVYRTIGPQRLNRRKLKAVGGPGQRPRSRAARAGADRLG